MGKGCVGIIIDGAMTAIVGIGTDSIKTGACTGSTVIGLTHLDSFGSKKLIGVYLKQKKNENRE